MTNNNSGPYTISRQKNYFPTRNHKDKYNLYTPLSQIVDLSNKTILDFGCGFGNLLISSKGSINQKLYTGLDIDPLNIKLARRLFPNANWTCQNLYNPMYNPQGQDKLQLDQQFDIIFSYSVFTHMSYQDLCFYYEIFKKYLKKDGSIIFSVYVQQDRQLVNSIIDKRKKNYGFCNELLLNNSVIYLANNLCINEVDQIKECDYLSTFYDKDFIQKFGKIVYTALPQPFIVFDNS